MNSGPTSRRLISAVKISVGVSPNAVIVNCQRPSKMVSHDFITLGRTIYGSADCVGILGLNHNCILKPIRVTFRRTSTEGTSELEAVFFPKLNQPTTNSPPESRKIFICGAFESFILRRSSFPFVCT